MANDESGIFRSGIERRHVSLGFIARAAFVLLLVVALANVLWLGRDLLFVAFFAVLVALFLSIFVDRLEHAGVNRVLGGVGVFAIVIGGLVGLALISWPTLQEQIQIIRVQLPQAVSDVTQWVEAQYLAITGELGRPDAEFQEEIETRLREEVAEAVAGALPLLNTVVGAVAGTLIALFAGLYLAIESRIYTAGLARLIPPQDRGRVQMALTAAGGALRRWMLGTVINMFLVGALTTTGLALLGIPAAVALGVLAGIFEFVPIFGPLISAVPAIGVALIISPAHALWVALLYTAIQQIESNLFTPIVMKGTVKLPPALTMIFQALMAIIFGFLGLLLAVPILAAGIVLIRTLYVEPLEAKTLPVSEGGWERRAS